MKIAKHLAFSLALLSASLSAPASSRAEALHDGDQWEWQIYQAQLEKKWNYAGDYANRRGDYYAKLGNYEKARHYFQLSADNWTLYGNKAYADANAFQARQYESSVEMYAETPAPAKAAYAKFEPRSGAYLGMFPSDSEDRHDFGKVAGVWGRQHAIALWYAPWGKPAALEKSYFPSNFAAKAKKAGAAMQIGFEPSGGLDEVKDGPYIREFAREAKASGVPVFLRFASEMNGDWVAWNGDPQKYIEKFRLVHDIMAQEAPNVAMVWSPNSAPADNIDAYYPGDAYVDWVGVSLYALPYYDGTEDLGTNQIDNFRQFYAKYSRKPIMISEGAVSQGSKLARKYYPAWATGQLANMYGFLPRMFPQVKAITYFNLSDPESESQFWDMTNVPGMAVFYKRLIQSRYFTDSAAAGAQSAENAQYAPLSEMGGAQGAHRAFAYIKLPLGAQPDYVEYWQERRLLGVSRAVPWEIGIDFSSLDKSAPITVAAYSKSARLLTQQNVYIKH